MPHNRLFVHVDPILELRKQNTTISITPGKAATRPKDGTYGFLSERVVRKAENQSSRQRSRTVDSISSATRWNRDSQSLNDHVFSKKVNATLQPNAKRFVYTPKTKPKFLATQETKSTGPKDFKDGVIESSKMRQGESHERLKQQVDAWRSRLESPERVTEPVEFRSTSNPFTPGPGSKYSISAIVKARTMAMKWRGKKEKKGLRRNTIMPTITDDSTKISLCANVKCSPQFEAVIKLLQNDEDVDCADSSVGLPSLKQ